MDHTPLKVRSITDEEDIESHENIIYTFPNALHDTIDKSVRSFFDGS